MASINKIYRAWVVFGRNYLIVVPPIILSIASASKYDRFTKFRDIRKRLLADGVSFLSASYRIFDSLCRLPAYGGPKS
jgi:hypothetical protein